MIAPSRLILFSLSISLSISSFAYEVGSRIRATGGVHQVEGSAGGGITPWAVIGGYGQKGEWGVNAFATNLILDDFDFAAIGFSAGFSDRVELSFARQELDISELGVGINDLTQDTLGIKVRVLNNLIYDNWPQISVGAQFKKNDDFTVPQIAGALDDSGTDFYVTASKLWLSGLAGYPLLLNGTIRRTEANQLGLLGFGGDKNDDPEWMGEISGAILLARGIAIGAEYRQKPDNLNFAEEEDWSDIFVAWFINKNVSVTAAWADLGTIGGLDGQSGFYISVQGTL